MKTSNILYRACQMETLNIFQHGESKENLKYFIQVESNENLKYFYTVWVNWKPKFFIQGESEENLKYFLSRNLLNTLRNCSTSRTIRCADPRLISRFAAISFTVTRRFSFTMSSTAAMPSGVTTVCAWPGRGQSVTELIPFMNFPVHSYTCCTDRHASPYWTSIRPWISMGFSPSLLKKTEDRTLFFFGACCKRGRHIYTTTAPSYCIPASHCHLSATLQTISITVANLQDNRAVVRIFIKLLKCSFDSPWYES